MHDLIKDGSIIQSRDFGSDTPPVLAGNKGEWFPRVTIGPPYDPATQNRELVKTVTATESVWTYTVTEKTQGELDAIVDGAKEGQLNSFNTALFEILYNYDKRLRVLEANPIKTKAEFRDIIKSLL